MRTRRERLATCRIDDLCGILQDLRELVGDIATLRIIETWGGRRLYVPAQLDGAHPIARRIGLDAARKLTRYYGGDTLDVPYGAKAIREQLYRVIRARYFGLGEYEGRAESAAVIAVSLGITERWVYEIVRRVPDDRQQTLF